MGRSGAEGWGRQPRSLRIRLRTPLRRWLHWAFATAPADPQQRGKRGRPAGFVGAVASRFRCLPDQQPGCRSIRRVKPYTAARAVCSLPMPRSTAPPMLTSFARPAARFAGPGRRSAFGALRFDRSHHERFAGQGHQHLDRARDPQVVATEAALMAEMKKLQGLTREVEGQVGRARTDLDHTAKAVPTRVAQLEVLRRRPELENVHIDPMLSIPGSSMGCTRAGPPSSDLWRSKLPLPFATWKRPVRLTFQEGQPGPGPGERHGRPDGFVGSTPPVVPASRWPARLESITLKPLSMAYEDAFQLAEKNRLDWMNARAALVDAWRGIAVEGEALKTGLDLIVQGEIPTRGRSLCLQRGDRVVRSGFSWIRPSGGWWNATTIARLCCATSKHGAATCSSRIQRGKVCATPCGSSV